MKTLFVYHDFDFFNKLTKFKRLVMKVCDNMIPHKCFEHLIIILITSRYGQHYLKN